MKYPFNIFENDFSFEKKTLSIDFLFKRIKECIRIKEYDMQEYALYQYVISTSPSKAKHFPSNHQHTPSNSKHSADKMTTLPDKGQTPPDKLPTLKQGIYSITTNHQHYPVKSPTLTDIRLKVFAICRRYGMHTYLNKVPDKLPTLRSGTWDIPTNYQHFYDKFLYSTGKFLKVFVSCREYDAKSSFKGFPDKLPTLKVSQHEKR